MNKKDNVGNFIRRFKVKFFLVATLHPGPCLENEQYCSVNLYYEPVCGSDHKIYTNEQSLLCVRHRQSSGKRPGINRLVFHI